MAAMYLERTLRVLDSDGCRSVDAECKAWSTRRWFINCISNIVTLWLKITSGTGEVLPRLDCASLQRSKRY